MFFSRFFYLWGDHRVLIDLVDIHAANEGIGKNGRENGRLGLDQSSKLPRYEFGAPTETAATQPMTREPRSSISEITLQSDQSGLKWVQICPNNSEICQTFDKF